MGNKLEKLLNSLIERGWLPRGEDKIHSCRYYEEEKKFKADYTIAGIPQVLYRSIRELCSREAGLWQFVCENGLLNVDKKYEWEYWTQSYKRDGEEYTHEFSRWCEKYRLIESSLKEESELEDFLLNSIKLD